MMRKLSVISVVLIFLILTGCQSAKRFLFGSPAFHFVFSADSRGNYTVIPDFSHKMVTLGPVFGFFAGDLCSTFDTTCINTQWKPAMDGNSLDGMLAKTFVSRGNHDAGTLSVWQALWDFPTMANAVGASDYTALVPNVTYSFDYSNSHFSVVDGATGGSNTWTSAQITWLDNDLLAAEQRGVTHEFLMVHGPMYGVTAEHGGEVPSSALKAVINKHPRLIGFHGHEHITAFTDVTPAFQAGITDYPQFTLGRAGAPIYAITKPVSWSADVNAFGDVLVDGDSVVVTIYSQAGVAVKSFGFMQASGTSTPVAVTNTPVLPSVTPPLPSPTKTSTPAVSTATPVAASATLPSTLTPSTPVTPSGTPAGSLTFPMRLMFYYPWYPESWTQGSVFPYTNYHPLLGFYDSSSTTVIQKHIAAMQYANMQGAIASWWGQGTPTDKRIPLLLNASANTGFKWSVYYEAEGQGNPTSAQISSDLQYLQSHYGNNPNFLHVNGRFVVFVYADALDACGMVDRWKQGNTVNAYIVLKVFQGYTTNCTSQPDNWHQYSPAVAANKQGNYSYVISPGFWQYGASVRLPRDLSIWYASIRGMLAYNTNFQLVSTFNEWGEGTAVEYASEWASSSSFGSYLDALHNNGIEPATATPSPTYTATSTATPSQTATSTSTPPPTYTETATATLEVPTAEATRTPVCANVYEDATHIIIVCLK